MFGFFKKKESNFILDNIFTTPSTIIDLVEQKSEDSIEKAKRLLLKSYHKWSLEEKQNFNLTKKRVGLSLQKRNGFEISKLLADVFMSDMDIQNKTEIFKYTFDQITKPQYDFSYKYWGETQYYMFKCMNEMVKTERDKDKFLEFIMTPEVQYAYMTFVCSISMECNIWHKTPELVRYDAKFVKFFPKAMKDIPQILYLFLDSIRKDRSLDFSIKDFKLYFGDCDLANTILLIIFHCDYGSGKQNPFFNDTNEKKLKEMCKNFANYEELFERISPEFIAAKTHQSITKEICGIEGIEKKRKL